MVLVAFGKENKAFFDNFCEVAKRIDLYGLPELSNKISESVSRWNELIAQAPFLRQGRWGNSQAVTLIVTTNSRNVGSENSVAHPND